MCRFSTCSKEGMSRLSNNSGVGKCRVLTFSEVGMLKSSSCTDVECESSWLLVVHRSTQLKWSKIA